jgi:hypothetical protein
VRLVRDGDVGRAESFFEMYYFFRGRAPLFTRILRELLPRISGRAVLIRQNAGLDSATVEVWRILSPVSPSRSSSRPERLRAVAALPAATTAQPAPGSRARTASWRHAVAPPRDLVERDRGELDAGSAVSGSA